MLESSLVHFYLLDACQSVQILFENLYFYTIFPFVEILIEKWLWSKKKKNGCHLELVGFPEQLGYLNNITALHVCELSQPPLLHASMRKRLSAGSLLCARVSRATRQLCLFSPVWMQLHFAPTFQRSSRLPADLHEGRWSHRDAEWDVVLLPARLGSSLSPPFVCFFRVGRLQISETFPFFLPSRLHLETLKWWFMKVLCYASSSLTERRVKEGRFGSVILLNSRLVRRKCRMEMVFAPAERFVFVYELSLWNALNDDHYYKNITNLNLTK